MSSKEITLTEHEIEELKDETKFRTTVLLELKRLRGIPDRVTSLTIHRGIHWVLISMIFAGLIGLFIRGSIR